MPFRSPQIPPSKKGKTPPPEETFEEAAYLKQLGESQKSVTIKLVDGEIVRGWVEYYDRSMIRLTREGAPNLFIFKHEIMYISDGNEKSASPNRLDAKPVKVKASRVSKAKPGTDIPEAPLTPAGSES